MLNHFKVNSSPRTKSWKSASGVLFFENNPRNVRAIRENCGVFVSVFVFDVEIWQFPLREGQKFRSEVSAE